MAPVLRGPLGAREPTVLAFAWLREQLNHVRLIDLGDKLAESKNSSRVVRKLPAMTVSKPAAQ